MDWTQTITIITTILVPMFAGFGWLIHQINSIERKLATVETRVTVIETILSMMGAPIRDKK